MQTLNLILIVLALSLTACGRSEPPPETAAQPAKPLPNSNVFSTDVRALQKAKDVQKTVDQQKQTTDQQLQEAEGH